MAVNSVFLFCIRKSDVMIRYQSIM